MPANGYWLEVVDATIPQNRAAASTLASARMAGVHSSFRFASGFAGCPYCRAKNFIRCHCKTINCDDVTRYKNGKKQSYCRGCNAWGNVILQDTLEVYALEQQAVNERKELVPANRRSASVYRGSSE